MTDFMQLFWSLVLCKDVSSIFYFEIEDPIRRNEPGKTHTLSLSLSLFHTHTHTHTHNTHTHTHMTIDTNSH